MNINRCKSFVTSLFSRGVKKAEAAAKEAEKVATEQHKTEYLYDSATGIGRYTREFTDKAGNTSMFVKEEQTLADGTVKSTMKVYGKGSSGYYFGQGDEGIRANVEKIIKREKGGSIMGGDRVTVEKNFHETMGSTAHTEKYVKEFNKKGEMEHIEAELKYRHWDKPEKAVQDRVYDGKPISHSKTELFDVNPSNHRYYKHSVDGRNNYYNFADGAESNYSRAVSAKEQAAIELEAKKAAEVAAAKAAEEKAAAELKAKMPRMNLGKLLGVNPEELTMVEKELGNGAVERTFTDPKTGKVVVKTFDHGTLHREEVFSDKFDKLLFKQLGDNEPYVLAKKGNYTQTRGEVFKYGNTYIEDMQYYYDGINSYSNPCGQSQNYKDRAVLKKPYTETLIYKEADEDAKKHYDRQFKDNPLAHLQYRSSIPYSNARPDNREINTMYEEAQKHYIDLKDLITPYKK